MMGQVVVPIDVPIIGDERRKNWAKIVSNVDPDKSDGWAYEGDFIDVGGIVDLATPAVLLIYGEKGSRTNPQIEAGAYVANTDGSITRHASASGRTWARTLRDAIAELVANADQQPLHRLAWDARLAAYSDEALAQELKRRQDST
ncbi:MAG: hypothetical protein KJO36_04420 [Acidimicrobiia bacterium]|nr:hypothetical protein [Acidimicrobiia bacterium]MBT8250584.1 hypothetical protein [Acidimicrobiia bacterium]NND14309.1 hypothetical protein [Acidimicrobiia bacterium]NNL47713.1 hypothetical protein [Acidimicrobiia bacterium]